MMTVLNRTAIGYLWCAAFLACVVLANYSISHWGTLAFPGGPHTVTILGLTAPSGVLFVGLSFTFRDLAQLRLGRLPILGAIVLGAGLSAVIASPELALASGLAFAAGESFDFVCYTPLAERGHWWSALVASNTVGSAVDTTIFLWVAFGSLAFWSGQFWLKTLMVIPAVIVLLPFRRAGKLDFSTPEV